MPENLEEKLARFNSPHAKELRQLIVEASNRPKNFRHKVEGGRGKIYLYDVISDWWGVSAEDIVRAIDAIGKRPIDFYINSPGGDVFEARAMVAEMKRHDEEILAYTDGLCASAATTVAMAAERRIISPGARFMIHRSWTFALGNSLELKELSEFLDEIDNDIAQDYANITSKSKKECLDYMTAETWFGAEDAVKEGFCDELTDSSGGDAPASAHAGADRSNRERLANFAKMLHDTNPI